MPIQTLKLHNINDEMQQCIQNCLDCHSMCLNTIAYCLEQGGHHAEPSHIRLMYGPAWRVAKIQRILYAALFDLHG